MINLYNFFSPFNQINAQLKAIELCKKFNFTCLLFEELLDGARSALLIWFARSDWLALRRFVLLI